MIRPAVSIFGKNMKCYDLESNGSEIIHLPSDTGFGGGSVCGGVLLGVELEASYAYVLCH